MNTIIATGNNFGAGPIQFTAFQDTNLLILNKEITFDPTNASYQAAEALETWPMAYLEEVVPVLVPIIKELDKKAKKNYKETT